MLENNVHSTIIFNKVQHYLCEFKNIVRKQRITYSKLRYLILEPTYMVRLVHIMNLIQLYLTHLCDKYT